MDQFKTTFFPVLWRRFGDFKGGLKVLEVYGWPEPFFPYICHPVAVSRIFGRVLPAEMVRSAKALRAAAR